MHHGSQFATMRSFSISKHRPQQTGMTRTPTRRVKELARRIMEWQVVAKGEEIEYGRCWQRETV